MKLHQLQRETLCKNNLEEAREVKTPEFTMSDPNTVLKQLKTTNLEIPLNSPTNFSKQIFQEMILNMLYLS